MNPSIPPVHASLQLQTLPPALCIEQQQFGQRTTPLPRLLAPSASRLTAKPLPSSSPCSETTMAMADGLQGVAAELLLSPPVIARLRSSEPQAPPLWSVALPGDARFGDPGALLAAGPAALVAVAAVFLLPGPASRLPCTQAPPTLSPSHQQSPPSPYPSLSGAVENKTAWTNRFSLIHGLRVKY
ncbi:uncharacterized protein LOC119279397 [Triticum dicoccoides]|uniref:uncharacterized protein LOC119279397 n=1 Tax=Triticum dicoccoides TaxID=85692 RepID=UPI00188F06D9|nr:uncharacterized protein LOC119279397 [Triticum dicoccoides]